MIDDCRLIFGDCLDAMGEIADGLVALIAADLPYQVTACRWDTRIPFEPMWAHFKRVLKPRGAVVLTASQPFTSMLVMSNREWFKYSLVWNQRCCTGFLNAKKAPLRSHQDIIVFCDGRTTYNPQMTTRTSHEIKRLSQSPKKIFVSGQVSECYGSQAFRFFPDRLNNKTKHPASIIDLTSRENLGIRGLHPTQKPVALFEYLIRTYSNPGETVLDPTFGSGTTGLACINTGRKFIGIEKDATYFEIARKRLATAQRPLIAV